MDRTPAGIASVCDRGSTAGVEIDGVNSVPIVGQPVVYGVGVLVLFVVGLSTYLGRYPLTFVHEGGHMQMAVLSLRSIHSFTMEDDTSGLTKVDARRWAFSTLLLGFAGYATAPLLGLGAAALVASGNAWSVLIIGLVFSLLAVLPARNPLALLVPVLVVVGIGWTLIQAAPTVQSGASVGIVWYLLIAGLVSGVELPTRDGDATLLRDATVLVPGFVWKVAWVVLAVVCLWNGGRLLLVPEA